MKKLIALTLSILAVLGMFAGCAATGSDATEKNYTVTGNYLNSYTNTLTPGTLTIAISPDFAPMEFVDPSKSGQNMYVGFDVTLAHYIADELGLQLMIMPMSFEACQTAVYSGTVDMAISGFSWEAKREANYNLSDYYYAGENENEQVLITLSQNDGLYTSAEDLAGKTIGVQNASLQQSLTEAQLTDSKIVPFTDLGTAVLQLKNGDFDCITVAGGNADAIIASNPEIIKSGFTFYVDPKETGNLILMQKGADELTEVVNKILADSEQYWDIWYQEANTISGIEQSYDDDGNAAE